jgi:secreted PhoX family phosphatase
MMEVNRLAAAIATAMLAMAPLAANAGGTTPYDPMMKGDTPATSNGWDVEASFTVGETVKGYTAPGILDGTGAFELRRQDVVRVLVNHELRSDVGYAYALANGTQLRGARVSFFDIHKKTRAVKRAGLAYDTIYDRAGDVVTDPAQLDFGGFNRFCSARGVESGELSFVDDIFFTGEETSGGTQWAIDVNRQEIWAVPQMGYGAWESWSPVDSGDAGTVALLGGDDRGGAPLYLYVGRKNAMGDGSFLDRNGLALGSLSCWKADDDAVRTPNDFNGFFNMVSGSFVELDNYDPSQAGTDGWDALGYATQANLDAQTLEMGCFRFSRPEDLHNNPASPTEVAFASTGRVFSYNGETIDGDQWGTVYHIAMDFGSAPARADIKILHDADALPVPDMGIRSPDNLTWADDGAIYVQEDRSIGAFGDATGVETSIWKLSPVSGDFARIAEMNRDAVAPAGSTDGDPDDLGDWESSGVLDVTRYFKTEGGETLLLGVVQAHSIRDGIIAEKDLVEGGQIIFLSRELGEDDKDDDYGYRRYDHDRWEKKRD